jgi:hypothetical protein
MTDRPAVSRPVVADLGSWTVEEAERYERARSALLALMSVCAERISLTQGRGNDDVSRLRDRRDRYKDLLDDLDPTDVDGLESLIRDAPDLLRELREQF